VAAVIHVQIHGEIEGLQAIGAALPREADDEGIVRGLRQPVIAQNPGTRGRRLGLDPLLQLVQNFEPPFPCRQLGDTPQLHNGLLRETPMLGLGAEGQSFVDVVG
jgi:hypothetical protein